MRNKLQKLVLAGAVLVSTAAHASEIRTPWISSRGPLRYLFEKLHEDKLNMNWWSAAHAKHAHKAFLKHSTKSEPLSALIFNKADFTLDQIFPGSVVDPTTEFFNPLFQVTELKPRVHYTEYGMTVGGCIDFPVWCNKGRIGLRTTIPFRNIEMERKDIDDPSSDPFQDVRSSQQVRVFGQSNGGIAAVNQFTDVITRAYRLDLVQALVDVNRNPILRAQANAEVTVLGTPIAIPNGGNVQANLPVALASTRANGVPVMNAVSLISSAGGVNIGALQTIANGKVLPPVAVVANGNAFLADDNIIIDQPNAYAATTRALNRTVAGFGATLPDATHLTYFQATANAVDTYADVLNSDAFKAQAKNLWLIFRRSNESNDAEKFSAGNSVNAGNGATVARGIENLLQQFGESAMSFFSKQPFDLETQRRCGIGDIDLDLFYEHTFNDQMRAELCLGVRLPTGGDKDQYGNPYKVVSTGNGEHWEIKLGGLFAWEPACWMNMKVDASYNFVLESKERRMAVFKGAQIKNFGPRADADVDWGYFIGHVDFTFFHPKTYDVRSMVGYEFYYKTEDHITFKQPSVQSWLGRKLVNGVFVDNPQALDSKLARKNTESIGHKIRSETSCQINKWFEIFAGGSYTFAGQNVMKDKDCHAGFNIRY